MDVDRILDHPEYNLRSTSRLAARDDRFTRAWLDGRDPLYEVYQLLRNRRVALRKEFYETAFVLDRLAPELSAAAELWELGAGHGMLGVFACILHRQLCRATLVDRRRPPSYERMREQVALKYPFVKIRTRFIEGRVDDALEIPATALVVGVHACGPLTDVVAETARQAGAAFAVVPCCEARRMLPWPLSRSVPPGQVAEALSELRCQRWRAWGYEVEERSLPHAVTARGRVLIGRPPGRAHPGR